MFEGRLIEGVVPSGGERTAAPPLLPMVPSSVGALRSLVSVFFNFLPACICFKSSLEAMDDGGKESKTILCRLRQVQTHPSYIIIYTLLVWLVSILLQLLFKLLRLAMSNLNRTNGHRISFLQLDWSISDIFT